LVLGVLLGAGVSAQADFLWVYAGAGYWNTNYSGSLIANVSVEDELNIRSGSSSYLYVAFEHPLPLVPNIKVARTGIQDNGNGTLARDFTFGGTTYSSSEPVVTDIELTNTDVTLYYEVVDLGMDLDIGLTGRFFQGGVSLNGTRQDINGFLPMIYGRARFGLPFTGTWVGGDINYMGFSGNQIADYAVRVGWETENLILPEIGIEGGYRRFSLDANADDLDVNIDTQVDGFFVNLTGHF